MPDTPNPTEQPLISPSRAEESYQRIQPTLDSVDIKAATMRGISVEAVIRRLMMLKPEYEALIPTLSISFKTTVMDPYREAVDILPDLLAAFHYVNTMTRSAKVVYRAEAAAEFTKLLDQIRADRQVGLATLTLMEQLHLVSSQQAAHIRSGAGYFDMAADSTELGALFERHWDKVSVLQSLNEDDTLRLTTDHVQRLKDNGTRLFELLATRGQTHAAQTDWERDRLAIRTLIDHHWSAIQHPVRFHLGRDNPTRAALYTTLPGIR